MPLLVSLHACLEIIMWGPQNIEALIKQGLEYSSLKWVDLTQMVCGPFCVVVLVRTGLHVSFKEHS